MHCPASPRWAFITLLASIALMVVGIGACQDATELQKLGAELDAVAAENGLIEGLNRLQLSAQQVEALIGAVRDLRDAAAPIEQERLQVLKELKPLMLEKRTLLIADEHPPALLREKIVTLEDQLRDLDQRLASALVALAPRFHEIFTDPQVSIITGAELARRQVGDLLEWVREMDDQDYAREAGPTAEELAEPEVQITEADIMKVFDAARGMSAAEYREKGAELRENLMPLYMPTEVAANHILVDFFIDPAMPKVLAEKLKAVTAGNG